MALQNSSLFLYGYTVSDSNKYLNFRAASGGSELTAELGLGYYSLTDLMSEISTQMEAIDSLHQYTVSADRSYNGGLENRVTIQTSGTYLDLLFSSGTNASESCRSLIGFPATDQTGATGYTGTTTTGTYLEPAYVGYNYIPNTMMKKTQGSVNISGWGLKEVITFSQNQFFEVEFKYEPEAEVKTLWQDLFDWMSQGRSIEFTPSISSPNTIINCTLDKTSYDGKGLGFKWKEMLPDFPFNYQTGNLTFRVIPDPLNLGD